MKTITFTTDLNKEIIMNENEFNKVVIETIEFAINDKGYSVNDLTVEFIVEDISGVIKNFHMINHKMNDIGLSIIKNVLSTMKSNSRIAITRPINGVTINGNESLLNSNNEVMLFENEVTAKEFLTTNGFTNEDMKDLSFVEINDKTMRQV